MKKDERRKVYEADSFFTVPTQNKKHTYEKRRKVITTKLSIRVLIYCYECQCRAGLFLDNSGLSVTPTN